MCEFCEEGKEYTSDENKMHASMRLVWSDGQWGIKATLKCNVAEMSTTLSVNYCPICGRKLNG